MNRLHDLRQTLPANIDSNADYANLTFVLLDYNSQDGLEAWVKASLLPHIASGRLVYYRTDEPAHYEMAHSRNVAFGLASADIVTNVDADNWARAGFAAELNRAANEFPARAVFVKSWQRMNGRVAFFKDEWRGLGGYDEAFEGYGYDDADLVCRALASGFTLARVRGNFYGRLRTGSADKVVNMRAKCWRQTQEANKRRSMANVRNGVWQANAGRTWGVATVVRNFSETIHVAKGCV